LALHTPTGTMLQLVASSVVLATGGAMRIFPLTTAPEELTGDGLAMAYRCGAELQDMEFPMFLPYTFLTPPALRGVIFSYDASALLHAHALNRHGDRYMARWDPKRMERTTRDINSVAAAVEILEGRGSRAGGTYLSLKHLPRNLVDFSTEWFPENMRGWRHAGFRLTDFFADPVEEAWEVAPAAHFWNGGVRIDQRCETSVPGLFAAGEGTAGRQPARGECADNDPGVGEARGRIRSHVCPEPPAEADSGGTAAGVHREDKDALRRTREGEVCADRGRGSRGHSP